MEYGWPVQKRQDHFKELAENKIQEYETKVDFMDGVLLPVWKIPLELPKYRIANGRTASLQLEWLADNMNFPRDFFSDDPEREEVQKVQHELLKKLIEDGDLLSYFVDPKTKIEEYLILDHLGFVINGNRRLCAWRELVHKNPIEYNRYKYITAVVLPVADDRAIDKLEGKLQIQQDIKSDYKWHALANMILDRMTKHKLDEKTVADFYGLTVAEVRENIEKRSYAEEYLKSRNREGQWSFVTDKDWAFRQLISKRKKLQHASEKKLFEIEAFALIDEASGGSNWTIIGDLHKHHDLIKTKLVEEISIDDTTIDTCDDLLAEPVRIQEAKLAQAIDKVENRPLVREIIKDTIEMQQGLDKERNTEKYVFKQLQKANQAIQSALLGTQSPNVSKSGVSSVIDSIEDGLKAIKEWADK